MDGRCVSPHKIVAVRCGLGKSLRYLVLPLWVLALSGCACFWTETSWRYVMQEKVERTRVGNADYIRVRGLIVSSSHSVKSTRIKRISEEETWIEMQEGVVSQKKGESGSFELLVPVTEKLKVIYFGREKTVIWSRK
jgi:hypothetical protein